MKSHLLFQQYIWLVNTIHRARKITLSDINRKWLSTEMSEGIPMARSTFNRHKDAIQDMFGIYIECDRRDGFKYFIGNAEVLEEESIQNWMLGTLSVNGILSESKSVHDRILLESIPSNGDCLHSFIDAMKQNSLVKIVHQKYQAEYETTMVVEPYCVKLFNRRWYALVRSLNAGSFFVLAFDRIHEIGITGEKFLIDKNFDAAIWFKECYGIVRNEDVEPTRIRLRAFGKEAFYLRDLPLHHTQVEVETANDHSDFEITIRPTQDFISPLMARGQMIKVLEPQWLANEIKSRHLAAASLYPEE